MLVSKLGKRFVPQITMMQFVFFNVLRYFLKCIKADISAKKVSSFAKILNYESTIYNTNTQPVQPNHFLELIYKNRFINHTNILYHNDPDE